MTTGNSDSIKIVRDLITGVEKSSHDLNTLATTLANYIAKDIPSYGKLEYLVSASTMDSKEGKKIQDFLKTQSSGIVRYKLKHVTDYGSTYYLAVWDQDQLHEQITSSPAYNNPKCSVNIRPISPVMVSINSLLYSAQKTIDELSSAKIDIPEDLRSIDVSLRGFSHDINFGSNIQPLSDAPLYLIEEYLPVWPASNNAIDDLRIIARGIDGLRIRVASYKEGSVKIMHKQLSTEGPAIVYIVSASNISELDEKIKRYPYFGNLKRTVTEIQPFS